MKRRPWTGPVVVWSPLELGGFAALVATVVGAIIGTGLEPGSVAELVAAFASSGALIVSLVILGHQIDERTEQRRAAERAQAARVSAWVDRYTPRTTQPDRYGNQDVGGASVLVRNASDLPVKEVWLTLRAGWSSTTETYAFIDTLGPGEERRRFIGLELDEDIDRAPPISVDFIDAAGRRWIVRSEGPIERYEDRLGRPLVDPHGEVTE